MTNKKINLILLSIFIYLIILKFQEPSFASIEEHIINSNVMIINKTASFSGSGTVIKYRNKIYVLSAGHLVNNMSDKIILKDGNITCKLKIIKWEYEENTKNPELAKDLLLLVPTKKIRFKGYVSVGNKEPHKGELVFQVGNPNQIEDILTEERVVSFEGYRMYYVDWTFPGVSGGGIFNKNKEIVGVVRGFYEEYDKPNSDLNFMICVAIRLKAIKEFLKKI